MNKLLTILTLMLLGIEATATNYYFSSSSGDDSRSGSEAQDSATPWQTLSKLNSIFSSLQPGDAVLFKRGDIFYGSITISKSGSSGSPITFGDYGSGNKPVITGLSDATGWTSIGSNLWESAAISAGQSTAMIATVGGVFYPMGKWPNGVTTTGWRTYSASSSSSLTDGQGTPPSNFVGGTLVIRKNQYTIQKGTITAQSGATYTYTQFSGQTIGTSNGYGYFVQNSLATLDQQNEWYWNGSTKKLDIYSTTTPTNVKVSTITTVITLTSRSWIVFNNLEINGSISDLVTMDGASNITFTNCDLKNPGDCGIWTNSGTSNLNFQNNTISNAGSYGIFQGSTTVSGNVISNNTITNTGMNPGMINMGSRTQVLQTTGIMCYGGVTIQANTILNSGFAAIFFKGNNALIKNNYCDGGQLILDEGSLIYSYVGKGNPSFTNQVIDGNIVLNSVGAIAGKSGTSKPAAGIYMDISCTGVQITNNTIAHCGSYGILMQDNQNNTVRGNTVYDCGSSTLGMWTDAGGAFPTRGMRITKNILVMKNNPSLGNVSYQTNESSATAFGVSDSNVIATPMNDVNAWYTASSGPVYNHYSLPQWLSSSGQDAHSKKSPKTISNVNDLRFEYNPTSSNKTVNLGATYIDVTGVTHAGTITLAPYSSAVLIYESGVVANQPPVANAGNPLSIILPVSLVVLDGSASSDSDGTIAAYDWSQISGPSSAIILTPGLVATTVNTLVQGVYKFELKVTDNQGAIGKDTVQITVNGIFNNNQSPIANASADITINLPANSTTVTGSGTDADGSITSFQWSRISGPSQFTIESPTQSQTVISNLAQGVYQFELQVTDNSGAIGKDTVQVTVNAVPNLPPVAYAGSDREITIPTFKKDNPINLSLAGTGTDTDGTIASYKWSKISGPECTIENPDQAQTLVSNLTTGVFTFELEVRDNQNAIGKDSIQIILDTLAVAENSNNKHVNSAIINENNTATDKSTLTIYPNPVTDNFTLELNNNHTGKMNVQIINLAGAVIRSFALNKDQQISQSNLSIKDLATGAYFVRVQIGSWNDTKKILKL